MEWKRGGECAGQKYPSGVGKLLVRDALEICLSLFPDFFWVLPVRWENAFVFFSSCCVSAILLGLLVPAWVVFRSMSISHFYQGDSLSKSSIPVALLAP